MDRYSCIEVWDYKISKNLQTVDFEWMIGVGLWNGYLVALCPPSRLYVFTFNPKSNRFGFEYHITVEQSYPDYYTRPINCILPVSSQQLWILVGESKITVLDDKFKVCGTKEAGPEETFKVLYTWKNKYVAVGMSTGSIQLFHITKDALYKVLKGHKASVLCLEGNSHVLCSAEFQGSFIFVWNEEGMLIRKLKGHQEFVNCLLFWNGLLWSCSGLDCKVKVWPLQVPWQIVRIIWIGWYKNREHSACYLPCLPRPVVLEILEYLVEGLEEMHHEEPTVSYFWKLLGY